MKQANDAPAVQGTPGPERLMQMAWGYTAPLMVEAGVRTGIFDMLAAAALTANEVCAKAGVSTRGGAALLGGLLALGLLQKNADRFSLAPEAAAFLVRGRPGYLGEFYALMSDHLVPRWLNLADVVKRGVPQSAVSNEKDGTAFFQKLVTAIVPMSAPGAAVLAETFASRDGEALQILDVAAGAAVWGLAIARRIRSARVTALDWADVLAVTRASVEQAGLSARFSFIEGDLRHTDFGGPYDAVVLGHILHSEGAAASRALLKKTFDSLKPGGTVAIGEWLVNAERSGPPHCLIFALNMVVATDNGDVFSFDDIAGWLREAGFDSPHLLEAPGPSPLILAARPR